MVIKITVTDINGCADTLTIKLGTENEQCILIPSAFSPNGDGVNDTWNFISRSQGQSGLNSADNVRIIDLFPNIKVTIFNRWGQQVYYSEGYETPWDGKYKGYVLPIDSYHYIIDYGDGSVPVTKQVTILK